MIRRTLAAAYSPARCCAIVGLPSQRRPAAPCRRRRLREMALSLRVATQQPEAGGARAPPTPSRPPTRLRPVLHFTTPPSAYGTPRETQPHPPLSRYSCSRDTWARQWGGKGVGDAPNMAAAAAATVTKTAAAAAATETAAALNKAAGVTRCSGQVVSSTLLAWTAEARLSRTFQKERQAARPGFVDDRLTPPGTPPQRRVARVPSVRRVTTRALPGSSAEGAAPVPSGVLRERRLGWRRRRAGAGRLRGGELPVALTGGRPGGAPMLAGSRGRGAGGLARRRSPRCSEPWCGCRPDASPGRLVG